MITVTCILCQECFTVTCILCQECFEVELDDFLEDDEHLCPECSKAAKEFIVNFEPNDN